MAGQITVRVARERVISTHLVISLTCSNLDVMGEMESRIYVPPGWPEAVRPPGAPDWEATASAFLLDCCPPEFRNYPVLRRHPVVLARFAAFSVEGQLRASRAGLPGLRVSLNDYVSPEVVSRAVDAWQAQEAHFMRIRRAVALVEEALRGRVFVRKL